MKHIHDRRYKYVFSHPIFTQRLLESFVHEEFVKDLDFDTMEFVKTDFISKKLSKFESDLIYKINYKDKPIYIFLLMEFQSTPDNDMPLRFLRYILELYNNYRKKHKSGLFPGVFPLLIYNGDDEWVCARNVKDIIEPGLPTRTV